jgi:hypothetical protein
MSAHSQCAATVHLAHGFAKYNNAQPIVEFRYVCGQLRGHCYEAVVASKAAV